ncbi:hypothetical protein GOP47_0015044 [Adiantum capillus-veneris]|uniref:Pentatricopeptide repeat-containing protein n=1 Tax=Adiantum capillus-veneris TaxID=13818 RepID=A0A9D4UMN1_ADICA|nr:hypothetical protein GOP47_0015044 [Adiantum capillus-veneris]
MVPFDKNNLNCLIEICEPKGHHGPHRTTDCLRPHHASLTWDYIHSLIQECASEKDLTRSRHIQKLIIFHGLDSITFYNDHLIRLYASCACLNEADVVFCRVPRPSFYTWTALITAHADLGKCSTALRLFETMRNDGYSPNKCLLLCILKICCDKSYSDLGDLVYDQLIRVRLESDVALGSLLVRVYGKCGCLHEAQSIFDHLAGRDTILWSAMVTAYCENGLYYVALNLLERMLREGTNPDDVMFLCMLKVCSSTRALDEGRLIHDLLITYGLESDVTMGSSLVDLYAKCGCLNEAQSTFDTLDHTNTVSWNALIAGYAQLGVPAMGLFDRMQKEEFSADKVTFLSVLKSCRANGDVVHGARLHGQIALQGLDNDMLITSALVGLYAKCGRLKEADGLFLKMPVKDVIAWGELINGCAEAGERSLALELFKAMQETGISPTEVTYLHALKACSSIENIDDGRLINHDIILYGFESNDAVGSSLVDMYAKCMELDDAHKIFDSMTCQDVVSWGVLIAAYTGYDNYAALEVFEKMQKQGVKADKCIYLLIIKACGTECNVLHGRLVHNLFVEGNSKVDMDLVNSLVDMYAKCGFIEDACKTFESSSHQGASAWGALIAACIENGFPQTTFGLFARLQELGLTPDNASLVSILKACGNTEDIQKGRLVHSYLMSDGNYFDSLIGNSLISMYFKCGLLREAANVFKHLKDPDSISWDSMIAGYSQNGHGVSALECFQTMQEQGLSPGPSTFACTLKACSIEGLSCQGRLLHDQILRNGVEKDLVVGNALVDMYAKCGGLDDAQKVFTSMTLRDEVSWGAILACNSLHGDPSNVLQLFARMQLDGIKPDRVTASCAAKACSSIGVMKLGKLIHDKVLKSGLETNVVVGTALVDMYVKFQSPKEALKAYDRIQHANEASWTAIMSASVQEGQMQHVKGWVNDLRMEGFVPDNRTHTSILAAGTRTGQIKEASLYIKNTMDGNAITPGIDHLNCVIDALGRVGQLNEAEEVLLTMPMAPDIIGWVSLLTACQTFGNMEVGSVCLDHVAKLDLNGTGSYVMTANMYADAQKWHKVSSVLNIRKSVGAWKLPGKAWLELAEGLHVFNVGEGLAAQGEVCSFKAVKKKMREQGFVPQVDLVLENRSEFEVSENLLVSASSKFTNQVINPAPTLLSCVESCRGER